MVEKIARFSLGCILLMFGLNYFLKFLPAPEMPLEAGLFLKALKDTGYMFAMIKCFELTAAVLFLLNRFVPLATFLIAPGIFNILMFHLFLDQGGLFMGVLLSGLLGIIVAYRKDAYISLLKP